ncbi:class I SAM-dependent methyltransferase [Novispirillum sp. DQ9]|uniref:class I SAM-dependent methyltransferase n=1 Tax=Novispirillum sp. DQ9 TaxID=3398612 RepID=UPI003C7C6C9C
MTIDYNPGPEAATPAGRLGMQAIRAAYRRYAPLYDVLFGRILDRGRHEAVASLNGAPGRRVLEIGVGTGLSLPLYSSHARVTGIDVSPEMLAKARHRAALRGLGHVEALAEMDGQSMSFGDSSFDVVVAMYVLSVTPDPRRLLAEMRRVCAPGGDILVVNRFTSEKPLRRLAERVAAPLSATIGFNTELGSAVLDSMAGLDFAEDRPLPGMAGARLLRWRKAARTH